MFKRLISVLILLYSLSSFCQTNIILTESKIKVGSFKEEVLYFGFSEGDKIIFDFKGDRKLTEVEITEYPNTSRFMEYRCKEISNRLIEVTNTGIYKFRFKNTGVAKRICDIQIQRQATNDKSVKFDSNVYWKTLTDTSRVNKSRLVLDIVDTIYDEICSFENEIWLHSKGHNSCLSNSASCTKHIQKLNYHFNTDEILVYIAADQSTANSYNELSKNITKLAVKAGTTYLSGGSSLLVDMFSSTTTGALVDQFTPSNSVNKVDIFLADKTNADRWYNSSTNFIVPIEGLEFENYVTLKQRLSKDQFPKKEMWLCLKNNNKIEGVPVHISIVARRLERKYRSENYVSTQIKRKQIPYLKD